MRWYTANLNGNVGENPGRVAFEPWSNHSPLPIQFIFLKVENPKPSEGRVIDSVGFVVRGIDAKVKAIQAAGATIKQPIENARGLWKRAVVTDPWGTNIELIESGERSGFHHITLRVPDPEGSINWYLRSFGGERTKLGGRLDAVKYGNTYLIVTRGDASMPSRGSVMFTAEPAANQISSDTVRHTWRIRAAFASSWSSMRSARRARPRASHVDRREAPDTKKRTQRKERAQGIVVGS